MKRYYFSGRLMTLKQIKQYMKGYVFTKKEKLTF